MKVGYIRVSTVEQNEIRQNVLMEEKGIDKLFIDKCSGKDTNRPKLKELMEFVREGDTVYIESFSRLARSTTDLLSLVESLKDRDVSLVSCKESLDTSTPQGKLMLTMLGAIAALSGFKRIDVRYVQRSASHGTGRVEYLSAHPSSLLRP